MAEFNSSRISVRAVIDGDLEVDIVGFSSDWEINRIPTAQLLLPVGVNVFTGMPAALHPQNPKLRARTPVKVYAKYELGSLETSIVAVQQAAAENTSTDCEFLIFDGYVSGTGYVHAGSQLQFVIGLQHWLIKLTESSSISYQTHPFLPGQMSYAAIQSGYTGDADQGATVPPGVDPVVWSYNYAAIEALDTDAVQDDLWGKGILPCLNALADTNVQWLPELLVDTDGAPAANTAAKAALARFLTSDDAEYTPVGLGTNLTAQPVLLWSIQEHIASALSNIEQLAPLTFWDIIVGALVPSYQLMVVPRINDAMVVPSNPLQIQSFKTIHPYEYDSVQLSMDAPQLLRAVALIGSVVYSQCADGFPSGVAADSQTRLIGLYDTKRQGVIAYRTVPSWLSVAFSEREYAQSSAGTGNTTETNVRSSAIQPEAGKAEPAPDIADANYQSLQPLAAAYAQSIYAHESIRGRQGIVQGPLRFDISPGSIVNVLGAPAGSLAVADDNGESSDFYGQVIRCSIVINSEAQVARTAFHLAHIRLRSENNTSSGFANESHPIWQKAQFLGTTLGATCVTE